MVDNAQGIKINYDALSSKTFRSDVYRNNQLEDKDPSVVGKY
jgi:hypothetical protein